MLNPDSGHTPWNDTVLFEEIAASGIFKPSLFSKPPRKWGILSMNFGCR